VKLYWRVKRDGKWTWQAAIVHDEFYWPDLKVNVTMVQNMEEE